MTLSYLMKHKFPIIKVDWNSELHLLAVSYRHHSISVFNCDPAYCPPDQPQKQPANNCIHPNRSICHSQHHQGYILDALFDLNCPNTILSSSDDHTVKAWAY